MLLFSPDYGPVGVQRKEINDLVASVRDGRLGRQLVLMKQLSLAIVLLEGRPKWTNDGFLLTSSRSKGHGGRGADWTRAQHHGVLWSIQSRGVWVNYADDLQDTIAWLSLFQKWCAKPRKTSSLESRPKGKDEFGKEVRGRDFGIHLLQSFPGVGREVAGNVVDHFKGVPLQWTVTSEELRQVKGIGSGRAKQLLTLLGTDTISPSQPSDPFPKRGKEGRGGTGKGTGTRTMAASGSGRSSASPSSSRTGQGSPKSLTEEKGGEDSPPIDDWVTIEEIIGDTSSGSSS